MNRPVVIKCTVLYLLTALIIINTLVQNNAYFTTLKYIYQDTILGESKVNLMLGSSSIVRIDVGEDMKCGEWLNRGIGGSKIKDIVRYIKISPLSITPDKILIYAGENDISSGMSSFETIRQYEDLISMLRLKYPLSQLHIIAIKPSPARKKYWKEHEYVNNIIKRRFEGKSVFIHNHNLDNSSISLEYLFNKDGIHLNKNGYQQFLSGINSLCQNR